MKRRLIIVFIALVTGGLNLVCILLYAFRSDHINPFPVSANELKTGDIIVRRSHGLISNWFAEMSQKDKRYSHAGMVIMNKDVAEVVSCSHDSNGLRHESVAGFTSEENCAAYGIYRIGLSDAERQQLLERVHHDELRKITFDDAFMLGNGPAFYCTEYIRDCIVSLHNDHLSIPVSEVNNWKYVAVDDLYLHPGAQLLITRTNSDN